MPGLTWVEDSESRSSTIYRVGRKGSNTHTRSYKVFGTTDDNVVHAEATNELSGINQYWIHPAAPNVQLRAESYSVAYLGDDAWQVVVNYARDGADDDTQTDPLKRSRSFDTIGGTQHITQALDNVTVFTSAGKSPVTVTSAGETKFPSTAPSMNGAIGVDDSGVKGVDVVIPALTWTETYDVPHPYVTAAYIKGVAGLTGSVNNAAFRSFAAGEVLFVGCSGSQEWDEQKGNGPWTLAFKFVASPNVTGQKIGDITNVSKKGHQYLWVRYEDDISSNQQVKKPKAVYINNVYRDGNFDGLGIGY